MTELRLLEDAEDDLAAIADYTIERFGIAQARLYRDGLFAAFQSLLAHPNIGTDQGHIRARLRRFVHRRHVIYYRVEQSEVVVVRILGATQDPLRHLD